MHTPIENAIHAPQHDDLADHVCTRRALAARFRGLHEDDAEPCGIPVIAMRAYHIIMDTLVKGTAFSLSAETLQSLGVPRGRDERSSSSMGTQPQLEFVWVVVRETLNRGSVNALEIALIALSIIDDNRRESYAVTQLAHQVLFSQAHIGSRWIIGVSFKDAPRFEIDEIQPLIINS